MSRPTWPQTWMALARSMGERSVCSRAGVGAVIVSLSNRIVATGYNGPPQSFMRRMPNGDPRETLACVHWCDRAVKVKVEPDYHDCVSIHAEANALMFCDRRDREGGTLYVSSGICWDCAKLVANSGLAIVHYVEAGGEHRNVQRSHLFLLDCGLQVFSWTT